MSSSSGQVVGRIGRTKVSEKAISDLNCLVPHYPTRNLKLYRKFLRSSFVFRALYNHSGEMQGAMNLIQSLRNGMVPSSLPQLDVLRPGEAAGFTASGPNIVTQVGAGSAMLGAGAGSALYTAPVAVPVALPDTGGLVAQPQRAPSAPSRGGGGGDDDDAKVSNKRGAKQPQMFIQDGKPSGAGQAVQYCPQCREHLLDASDQFCRSCGTRLQ